MRFAQVGANDGKLADPILRFIETGAWQGVMIEPHPAYFADLSELHRGKAGIQLVNCAVSNAEGQMQLFHLSEAEHGAYPSWARGCASLKHNRLVEVLTGKRKDGTVFPIQLSISAFQGRHGRRFVGLLRDLSVQRAAEQEARLHRGRLAHIDRVNILGEMATGIAHEINQPLSAISMYAQSCLRYLDAGNPKPDRLQEALEKLSQQAHRAGAVIEHMQQFARQRDTDREQFNCNSLIRQVVSLADSDAVMRNIDIVPDLDEHPCLSLGDVVQIEQVILNLLRNGMESMESVNCKHGKQIILSTRCDSDTVTIAVSDSGAGVSDKAAELLFQPFNSTKQMGMGIGLTICQSIVQAHGGKLDFRNNEEHGATFQFTLPHFSMEET